MGLAGSAFKDVGKEFPKGTILFKEGDEGREMFLINSGEVKLSRKTSQGDVVFGKIGLRRILWRNVRNYKPAKNHYG